MKIQVTILMEPVPKGRVRATVRGGHAHLYTPGKTVKSEAQVVTEIRHSLGSVTPFPTGVPVRMSAVFFRTRPKHLPKKVTLPVSRPDTKNYLALLEDALNKFAYEDDSQITTILVAKRFVEPGGFPRIELSLEEDH